MASGMLNSTAQTMIVQSLQITAPAVFSGMPCDGAIFPFLYTTCVANEHVTQLYMVAGAGAKIVALVHST